MSLSGELEKLPLIQDMRETNEIIDRAFAKPEEMIEVVSKDIEDSFSKIVEEYPYLKNREIKIPPRKVDLNVLNFLDKGDEEFQNYLDQGKPDKSNIFEEPAEVPTYKEYVNMVKSYWKTDGCTSCPFCENARYGKKTVELLKHQSKVFFAANSLAELGFDQDIIDIADMSILDGLETYVLTSAIEVNRFLPRSLARLEKLLAKDDYTPFNAYDESIRFASPKMAEVYVMNDTNLDDLSRNTSSNYNRTQFDTGDYVYNRLAEFKPNFSHDVSKLAEANVYGLNSIQLAQEIKNYPTNFGYATSWLKGYINALKDINDQEFKPRLNPDVYNQEMLVDLNDSDKDAVYALAYNDLNSPEEAWLHLIGISNEDLRIKTALNLADSGNIYAFNYLDELTK